MNTTNELVFDKDWSDMTPNQRDHALLTLIDKLTDINEAILIRLEDIEKQMGYNSKWAQPKNYTMEPNFDEN